MNILSIITNPTYKTIIEYDCIRDTIDPEIENKINELLSNFNINEFHSIEHINGFDIKIYMITKDIIGFIDNIMDWKCQEINLQKKV